jgi:hypothetical protein
MRHGGGRAHRAQHRRGMPALQVIGVGLARQQLRPDFVTYQIGAQRVRARGAQIFALGQHRWNQYSARMAAERDVVVVERVGGGGVDQCRIGCGRTIRAEQYARFACSRTPRRHELAHDAHHRFVPARNHGGDSVGESGAHDARCFLGNRRANADEMRDRIGQAAHVSASFSGIAVSHWHCRRPAAFALARIRTTRVPCSQLMPPLLLFRVRAKRKLSVILAPEE